MALTASSAALVLASGVTIVAFASPGSHASLVAASAPEKPVKGSEPQLPAAPLQLVSVSPASGARGVNGASAIRVRFSAPLAATSPMPSLSPSISGHWTIQGDTAVFVPAVDGTFPVYLKFYFSYMKGTNPDGSKYNDPVYWASYFNGGDAVHQFSRYSYGSYQSLGCVELPWDAAKKAYPYLTYGSLVTVTGPVA